MDNQQVTLAELGWLAGIIDGEGYIGLCPQHDLRRNSDHRVRPELHISNTDEAIILKAHDIIKRMGVNAYIRAAKANTNVKKDQYRLTVLRMSQALSVLKPCLPYLTGDKQERARLIVQFIELRQANEGIRNPNIGNGKRGAGRIKPLTTEEQLILDTVNEMSKRGTSEAIREARRETSVLWQLHRERQRRIAHSREDMVQPPVKAGEVALF